jgi:hypothetical protein
MAVRVLLAALLSLPLIGQTMSTVGEERDDHNNTSAADGFRGNTDQCGFRPAGNPPAGNVSKLPIRSLLPSGATTRIYAHFLPWFCTDGTLGADNIVRCNGHILSGYNSNDPVQVRRQIEDMISRGIDGVIIDWYGPDYAIEDATTKLVFAEAERHPGFEVAIMEDVGALKVADDKVRKLIADLEYVDAHYSKSPAYMKREGRPVLFFFIDPSVLTNAQWDAVAAGIDGNPLFIFQNKEGFSRRQSDGGFAWLDPQADPPRAYLDDFYACVKSGACAGLVFGSAFQGFHDVLAEWAVGADGKKVTSTLPRRCGQTWLSTFDAASVFDSAHPLRDLQIVTWNDYDEGTEIESGIDNCLVLVASTSGHELRWDLRWTSPDGDESTIDHYLVYSSTDREHLTLLGQFPRGTHSVDLDTLALPDVPLTFYVKAVGRPSVRNHFTSGTSWTRGTTAEATVTVSSPTEGEILFSPIHVVADEVTDATDSAMQIYLDGELKVDRQHTKHLDEYVSANPGPHEVAVKAFYSSGPGDPVIVNITVAAGETVVISIPAQQATVPSPIRVVADEITDARASSMQIYLDGQVKVDKPNVDHLDEFIVASPGPHQIAVKAWYPGATPGLPDRVDVTVSSDAQVIIGSPAPCSTLRSPIHVLADEVTEAGATLMQIYLDGELVLDKPNVEHVDAFITAPPGVHVIAVKAWYGGDSGEPVSVWVNVVRGRRRSVSDGGCAP